MELHTDIEVRTLSSSLASGVQGPSSYHEIDVVLLKDAQDRQRPAHNQVILGVECKAQTNFKKDIVRQVLGVRRELSFYRGRPSRSPLRRYALPYYVNAAPPSEYWLAFVDAKGMDYRFGPERFGIEFKHWIPK